MGIPITFLIFAYSMIYFRAPDLDHAFRMQSNLLFSTGSLANQANGWIALLVVPVLLLNGLDLLEKKLTWTRPVQSWAILFLVAIFTISLAGQFPSGASPFIYFQF